LNRAATSLTPMDDASKVKAINQIIAAEVR
jgi:hypothetical protein